jgi:hypothetical protein
MYGDRGVTTKVVTKAVTKAMTKSAHRGAANHGCARAVDAGSEHARRRLHAAPRSRLD